MLHAVFFCQSARLVDLRPDFTSLFVSVALGLESAYDLQVFINQPNACGVVTYFACLLKTPHLC
jgi:hypothetical protein